MVFSIAEMKIGKRQQWLQTLIAPRPIGLVSTIDSEGIPNLAPFSFFNLFSSNPPIVIFSPARRVRDNSCKHTLQNVAVLPEVVINLVDYSMIHQVNIASADYGKEVNEFIKAGLTMEPAATVKPFMVKESKVKFECRVMELKPLGTEGGAGILVICEVTLVHVNDCILDEYGNPDYAKFQPVARMGGNWYCEIKQCNLFELKKPPYRPVGIDQLPACIKQSVWFNNRHKAQLATVGSIPAGTVSTSSMKHHMASVLLNDNAAEEAWQLLMT